MVFANVSIDQTIYSGGIGKRKLEPKNEVKTLSFSPMVSPYFASANILDAGLVDRPKFSLSRMNEHGPST